MLLARNISSVEAPALVDEAFHFIPNIYILHKKVTHQRQERTRYRRRGSRCTLRLITMKHYRHKTMLCIPEPTKVEPDDDLEELNQQQMELERREAKALNEEAEVVLVMDQAKEYERFLKRSNLSVVAQKYEKACLSRRYNRRLHERTAIFRKTGKTMRLMN